MEIILHRRFIKKFLKHPSKIQEAFKNRRNLFWENPFHPLLNNHPLTGNKRGQWSINVTGDWRAIYIFKEENTIIFIDIDIHSNLYK